MLHRGAAQLDPEECLADQLADVSVEVQNDNFYDATIYAVNSGVRDRLGVVEGGKTSERMIPILFR